MNKINFTITHIVVLLLFVLSSCSASRQFRFSNNDWKIQERTGYIVSTDSVYCFTIGENISSNDISIIGSSSPINDCQRKYLNQICKSSKVKIDSILCYIPEASIMVVTIDEGSKVQPSSVTTNIDKDPYTMWVRDDDADEGIREYDEIFSNTILDKKNKSLIIIDRMSYKRQNIAFIKIIQSNTKKAQNMSIPTSSLYWADVTNPRNLDAISFWIMPHRELAMKNYKLGNTESHDK